ncbi:MAG TPA: HAD family hydrolase [Candidatus Eremiobacteraceae bacterium]|nr:HAD family hydrolase [Candidatus Eremiobacteraceae bacterium]
MTVADLLPSWNEGPAKAAIVDFVQRATDKASPDFVREEDRFATFDQDGTLWVEHPMYTQLVFALDRVVALAPQHPEWKNTEPFKSVLAGDKAALSKFTMKDLEAIVMTTHAGVTTEAFAEIVADWIAKARDPRWGRPYTELTYQPMLEVMNYLRASGFRVYLVTGGGQAFVRAFAQKVYGVPPEHVIGSAAKTEYVSDSEGRGVLMKQPDILLFNDVAAKPEDIYLFLGRRPHAAFGNSTGDQAMLEYTSGNRGARLMMLVFHDDAAREYLYGPATGLPDTPFGTFTQALYDDAKAKGWIVISMKNDWKRLFAFEASTSGRTS